LNLDNLNDLRESLFQEDTIGETNEKALIKNISSHLTRIQEITNGFSQVDKIQQKIIFGIFDKLNQAIQLKQMSTQIIHVYIDYLIVFIEDNNF
jgi:hypothetical protein